MEPINNSRTWSLGILALVVVMLILTAICAVSTAEVGKSCFVLTAFATALITYIFIVDARERKILARNLFYDWLDSVDARERWRTNVKNEYSGENPDKITDMLIKRDLDSIMLSGFVWRTTPEGPDYWLEVSQKFWCGTEAHDSSCNEE